MAGTTFGVGMALANGLSDMGVSTGLLQKVWEAEIITEKVQWSVMSRAFQKLSTKDAIVVGERKVLPLPPGKCVVDITPENKAARSVTVTLDRALNQAGETGTATLMDNEEQQRYKYVTAHANDWKHAVAGQLYGINARELGGKKVHDRIKPKLARWWGETDDLYMHQALIEGRSSNCATAPVSAAQPLCPNVMWMGEPVSSPSQPTEYSEEGGNTNMHHAFAGTAALETAGNQVPTVGNLIKVAKFAQYVKFISPIMDLPNGPGYLGYMSPAAMAYMRNPANSDSFAHDWLVIGALQDTVKMIPGVEFKCGNIYLIEDPRCATLSVAGNSTSNGVVTVGYALQGRTDTRTSGTTANQNFDANLIVGEGALLRMEMEAGHYEKQLDEYGEYENVGFIGAMGYRRTDWNLDSNADSTWNHGTAGVQCEGVLVIPTDRSVVN